MQLLAALIVEVQVQPQSSPYTSILRERDTQERILFVSFRLRMSFLSSIDFLFFGTTAPRGPGPLHTRGF
jgi:hypothetical protein